jgi:hypothetical protein
MSFMKWLEENRFTVVEVDPARGRLRLRGSADACQDLVCPGTVVLGDDGQETDLAGLNAGDTVKVDGGVDQMRRIVVVRRVWDDLTSPEF